MSRKSSSSKSQTQQQTSSVVTTTTNQNFDYDYSAADLGGGTVIQGSSAITLTDRGAVNDAFEFSEGVLLTAGDFIIDTIAALSDRDEQFVTNLAENVTNANSDTAALASNNSELIKYGTLALIAGAAAYAWRK